MKMNDILTIWPILCLSIISEGQSVIATKINDNVNATGLATISDGAGISTSPTLQTHGTDFTTAADSSYSTETGENAIIKNTTMLDLHVVTLKMTDESTFTLIGINEAKQTELPTGISNLISGQADKENTTNITDYENTTDKLDYGVNTSSIADEGDDPTSARIRNLTSGQDPLLLVSNTSGVYMIDMTSIIPPVKLIRADIKSSSAFDFDLISKEIFWFENDPKRHQTNFFRSERGISERHLIGRNNLLSLDIAIDGLNKELFSIGVKTSAKTLIITKSPIGNIKSISIIRTNTSDSFTCLCVDPLQRSLYWLRNESQILRSNYNGENIQSVLVRPVQIRSMAVDYIFGRIYCNNFRNSKLEVTAIDGKNGKIVEYNIKTSLNSLYLQGQYLFWINKNGDKILKKNIQFGTKIKTLLKDSDMKGFTVGYTGYPEKCPHFAKCFHKKWVCLTPNMICDKKKDCFNGIDEINCCNYTDNCRVHNLYFKCSTSENIDPIIFKKWINHSFSRIFGIYTLFGMKCSLEVSYVDENRLERYESIPNLTTHYFFRQLLSSSGVFGKVRETLKALTLLGGFLSFDRFLGFYQLREITIFNTRIDQIGRHLFEKLGNLLNLTISNNNFLNHIDPYAFDHLASVQNISLSGKLLRNIILSGKIPFLSNKTGTISSSTIKTLVVSKAELTYLAEYIFQGFENLRSLTISNCPILSHIENDAFNGLLLLGQLIITENPLLSTIDIDAFRGLDSLRKLYIVDNKEITLKTGVFKALRHMKYLNISSNGLEILERGILEFSHELEYIDIRRNDLHLTSNVFQYCKNLKKIYSDSFSFCCIKQSATACIAPKDDISSCNDLIEDRSLRTCLWEIAILAIFGNIVVLAYRFVAERSNLNQSFSILVINLGVSDTIMGVYMMIIAIHDSLYEGEYVWKEYDWRHSTTCTAAGIMALFSSETSVVIIGIITIDRYLAVKYPLGKKRFTVKRTLVLSAIAWIISLSVAIIPAFTFTGFYSYSGVCLALPLSGDFTSGWQFAVAVFLGVNFFIFCFITIGQICIFKEIKMSGRLLVKNSQASRERNVAKILLMVVLTNLLCWMPVGVMVIMALSGIEISKEIYAWVIVFILPVNSAINPILYTFGPIVRKKLQQLRNYDKGIKDDNRHMPHIQEDRQRDEFQLNQM